MTGYSFHQRLANILCVVTMLLSFPLAETHAERSVQNPMFTVNTTNDTLDSVPGDGKCADILGKCSLRAAIQEANADNRQTYLVNIPAGSYVLTIPGAGEDNNATGDLDVHTNLILTGAGVNRTTINARALDRVLQVHQGASLTIQGVTLTGGWTADGIAGTGEENGGDSEGGGGIYNAGTLSLKDSAVTANQTGAGGTSMIGKGGMSGNGGGIYNSGSLTLDHTDVFEDNTGLGGTGASFGSMAGGASGRGGGIYNIGWLSLDQSNVLNNSTGQGGNGMSLNCASNGMGGASGDGGGIYNANFLWLKDSRLSANATGPGGRGGIAWLCDDIPQNGGIGGSGGGVYNTGYMWVETSEFSLNSTGGGGGAAGSGGQGGGIYSTGWLEMRDSQIRNNAAGAGAYGEIRFIAGSGGSGGGIYNIGQMLIVASLIEGNLSGSGGPGGLGKGGGYAGGPAGSGGGVFNAGLLSLDSTSLQGNATGSGGSAYEERGAGRANGGPGGYGGGLYNESEANLWNSPVTGNITGNGGGSDTARSGGSGGLGGGIYNKGSLDLAFSPVLSNTTGIGGTAGDAGPGGSGGGIYNTGALASRFSPVKNNLTGQGGGGTSSSGKGGDGGGFYSTGSLDINGAEVYKNKASLGGSPDGLDGDGGGLYISAQGQLILTNAIVAENSIEPGGKGSGIYLGAPAELLHTTLARNTGGDGSAITVISSSINLTNTILVSHTVGISVSVNSTATLGITLWGSDAWANGADWSGSGAIFTGTKNIWADPLFVNPDALDYHLSAASPAIDQGLPTWVDTDIDNQPRPNPTTSLPDLGADEIWTLIPIDQVGILGPITVTANTPVTYSALITPSIATPNITYFWTPDPQAGQYTPIASYKWGGSGAQDLRVMAMNAGGIVTDTLTIHIQGITLKLYLPTVSQGP